MPTLALIPEPDRAEFSKLPDPCRAEVFRWLRGMAQLESANRVGAAIERFAASMGLSAKRCRTLRDYYRHTRDWRVFINRSKYKPVSIKLPAAFIDFWRGLCERNQRKCAPAYRELIREWRAGLDIPGYAELPAPSVGDIPAGWSYQNLCRHKPARGELDAARIGRTAFADSRPLVFTTRVGLRVGQYYLFDDMWHDHKVHIPGQRQARRPLEFHALDLASADKFAWGLTAQMEDLETGKLEHLKEAQMRFLVASILAGTGYSPEGTILVVEHGTAAITAEMEGMLYDLSGGLIRVDRSGIGGAAAFAGQYAGRSKGNFRFKAALESLGNLIHNEMAFLPGQVGRNSRVNPPEELHGREREHDALCRAMLALPPERAQLLRLPFLDLETFRLIAAEIYRRINGRTEHDLEGWERCGYVTGEYRFSIDNPWLPVAQLLALPGPQQAAIHALIDAAPNLTRVRRMSPAEVFAAGSRDLVKFAPHQTALLLGPDLRVERSVAGGLFEFEDKECGPDIFRYVARVDGEALKDRERYATVLNPIDMTLHVFNAKGGYIGQCERWGSISRADTEALQRQMGRAAKIEAEMLYPVARRGAELTRRRIADAKHNAQVLGGKPVTRQERNDASESRARIRAEKHTLKDLLPEPVEAAPGTTPEEEGDTYSFSDLL
ncbi:MAG: hypothetical protein PHQ12_03495 [Chthoniobacteraceae bacterium]|nr:hypothetical protein [Chthoniobacteraceae bacterium]